MRRWGLAVVLLGSSLGGCVIGQHPVEAPEGPEAATLVGSAALPEPMSGIARHPWIALRDAGASDWERYEVMCCDPSPPLGMVRQSHIDPLSDYGAGGGDVRVHRVWEGKEAERVNACVRREVERYPYADRYLVWPGPNSNTFVDWVARACDLNVELFSTSVGKDFRGLVLGFSTTAGGTGVQLETPLVGAKLGVTEGVELHILGMSWGVDVWPPALIVPVGSGRLGFDDR